MSCDVATKAEEQARRDGSFAETKKSGSRRVRSGRMDLVTLELKMVSVVELHSPNSEFERTLVAVALQIEEAGGLAIQIWGRRVMCASSFDCYHTNPAGYCDERLWRMAEAEPWSLGSQKGCAHVPRD